MTARTANDVSLASPWFAVRAPTGELADLLATASETVSRGEADEAVRRLGRACRLRPNDVSSHLRLGVLLAHSGRLLEAQDAFVAALDASPGNLDALLSLGQICRATGHMVEAIDLLEHARRVHGNQPDIIAALTEVAIDLGDEDGAIRLLVHLRRAAPTHRAVDMLVGSLAARRSRARLATAHAAAA
jgi:cytochrome c-type biogenesis protein CcmH/NrfG